MDFREITWEFIFENFANYFAHMIILHQFFLKFSQVKFSWYSNNTPINSTLHCDVTFSRYNYVARITMVWKNNTLSEFNFKR